ncbi:MAG: lipid-binding SYLF domain-containing protein [Lacipirellulaceae bacterium]
MRVRIAALALVLTAEARAQVPPLPAISAEEQRVLDATTVFQEMLGVPAAAIPKAALAGAHGVAIVPRVIKGGFIIGARHGAGVFVGRDAQGTWHAPVFLTLTGGNIGWQAGVQATDVVLVYRSQRSVDSLLAGKLTLGADVAAAAGPVGRNASAATDAGLKAELYSYSRSRGLFAGVSLDGSVLKIDHAAGAAYYRPAPSPTGAPAPVVPAAAQRLVTMVVEQAGAGPAPVAEATVAPAAPPAAPPIPGFGPGHELDEAVSARDQLAEFSPRLYRMLDPAWQQHLAMPAEVFQEVGHPTPDELAATAALFDAVAADPRFVGLTARPEFQTTHALVRQYAQARTAAPTPLLALPPPPR